MPLSVFAVPYQHRSSCGCFQSGPGPRDLQGRLPQRAFSSLRWRGRRTPCASAPRVVLRRRQRRGCGWRWERRWPGVRPQLLWGRAGQTEEGEAQTGEASGSSRKWTVKWRVSWPHAAHAGWLSVQRAMLLPVSRKKKVSKSVWTVQRKSVCYKLPFTFRQWIFICPCDSYLKQDKAKSRLPPVAPLGCIVSLSLRNTVSCSSRLLQSLTDFGCNKEKRQRSYKKENCSTASKNKKKEAQIELNKYNCQCISAVAFPETCSDQTLFV